MKITIYRVEKCVKQNGSLVATNTRYVETFEDAVLLIRDAFDPSITYTIEQINIQ